MQRVLFTALVGLFLVGACHVGSRVAGQEAGEQKAAKLPSQDFDILTAREVRVVDEDGQARVTVQGSKGGAGVYVGRADGPMVSLYTRGGDAAVCFYRQAQSGRTIPFAISTVHGGKNGEGQLQVVDEKGQVRFIEIKDLLPKGE